MLPIELVSRLHQSRFSAVSAGAAPRRFRLFSTRLPTARTSARQLGGVCMLHHTVSLIDIVWRRWRQPLWPPTAFLCVAIKATGGARHCAPAQFQMWRRVGVMARTGLTYRTVAEATSRPAVCRTASVEALARHTSEGSGLFKNAGPQLSIDGPKFRV